MWKTIRIDVSKCEVKSENLKEEYKLLGGRALITQFLTDEVDPTCDPLGAQNKLLFVNGIYAGTNVSTAHRLNVGGKSPLTGGIKESNTGGLAATYMAGHGIKMIVIDNIPSGDDWKIVHIDADGNIQLKPADGYIGLNTYGIVEKGLQEYGADSAVFGIGRSGEKLYNIAGIAFSEYKTTHPCRLAARGGLGALMGSKKIKAVIIEKPNNKFQPEIADESAFKDAALAYNKSLAAAAPTSPIGMFGSYALAQATSQAAVLPVKNFSGEFTRDMENFSVEHITEKILSRGGSNSVGCQPGCIIKCSNTYNDENGKFLTAGFEYETIGLCGSNIDITNIDTIARIDRYCDDFGIDTIETGAAIGVCMDAGYIEWGNPDQVFKLLNELDEGTEFGKLLGQGTEVIGKHLGHNRIPTVKGQAIAAYEPRNLQATGITYATTAMGGDHTCGPSLGITPGFVDDTGTQFQPYVSKLLQLLTNFVDNGLCLFPVAILGLSTAEHMAQMYSSMYGVEFGTADLLEYSMKQISMEKAWNARAGFTNEDDRLPDFFYKEASPATGAKFEIRPEVLDTILKFM